MRRPDQAVASHVGAAQGQCICGNLARQLARRPRSVSVLRASRFLGSQQLCNKSHNGTCRLSMRNRAFHFEVGGQAVDDENVDEEQAFQDFSNLERQTKVVDENRRRRYFESASDFRKRMVSQRFTSIRRSRQDSWVQAYSEVYEDEPSPFQDMFEQAGPSSLFDSPEFVSGGLSLDDGAGFEGRQTYGNGKPESQQAPPSTADSLRQQDQGSKQVETEKEGLKDGFRKPLSSRARTGDEAVPQRPPSARSNGQRPTTNVDQRVSTAARTAEQPQRAAVAEIKRQKQVSDAHAFEEASATQGNLSVRADAAPATEQTEPLSTNQLDAPAPAKPPGGSNAPRKLKKKPKGFAGSKVAKAGKASSPSGGNSPNKSPSVAAGRTNQPQKASKIADTIKA